MCVACGRKYRSPQAQPRQASALKSSSPPSAGAVVKPAPVTARRRGPMLKYPRWKGRSILIQKKKEE